MCMKEVNIEDVIDTSNRFNNPVIDLTAVYAPKVKKKFKGCIVDVYEADEEDEKKKYIVFYDIEKKQYQRRLRKLFFKDSSIPLFKKPEFSPKKYVVEVYNNLSYYVDFVDEYDKKYYIVHLVNSERYMKMKKSVIRSIKEVEV